MPVITPSSLLLGVIFANHLSSLLFLPPLFFAFMTFCGSLNCGFSYLKQVLRHPKPLFLSLFLLHVFIPAVAYVVSHLVFPSYPYLITGIMIEFAVPTGIISLIWVTIYGGNIALTLSIILIDTLLAPFLIPLTLQLFVGTSVSINGLEMMKELCFMVAFPALLAMAVHDLSKEKLSRFLSPRLAPFSKLAIIPVIAINSSKLAPFFSDIKPVYIACAAVIFLLALSGYISSFLVCVFTKQNKENTISIFFNSSLRNISAGAVIAVRFFPAETVFSVMIGTLFQQVLAACAGHFLSCRFKQADQTHISG